MALADLFDRVYVISLPASVDRRNHIRAHFRDIGIENYTFHDACDGTSPEVAALYGQGRVAQYPPCFRCGKLDCGQPDCNNVLIPAQVAVVASYLGLWTRLAATSERALVCEDDVVFHPWWRSVLDRLHDRIAAGEVSFAADAPGLLRLGWALDEEHRADTPFAVSTDIRMSNPCHAITSAHARALLAEFDGVKHTADVFQHRIAKVSRQHARTVFPPIASELSWSTGSLESLIHPKDVRADYLAAQGRHAEADQHRTRVAHHLREIAHRKSSRPLEDPAGKP